MRFYQFRNWFFWQIPMKLRLKAVVFWYMLSLILETRKHSLKFASVLSGFNPSRFSKFLRNHTGIAAYSLEELSKKQAKRFSKAIKALEGLSWKIAIIIDATLQGRAGLHTQNSQRFNHGQGFVIGHQWTNIVLIINGVLIPLPPIPFYSKNYCKVLGIKYATEHERLVKYLKTLELELYLGPHCSTDVVVLTDSGYDDKKIQNTILEKKWHFIIALKCRRGVKSDSQYLNTPKSTDWGQIAQFFKDHRRLAWQTICVTTKSSKDKRMEFRIKHTIGYLKGVSRVQLVCSEFKKRRLGRRKYLACSDLRVTPKQILIGYRLRWKIEIFHKQIKQHLGFEDIAPKYFCSVETHVYLVYCAYILLHADIPGLPQEAKTILDKQTYIKSILEKRTIARILQILTQFGGVEKYKDELKAVLLGI
jgi:hypothetical protein